MKLIILTALDSEASPLIDYFQLKKVENRYFSIYQSEEIFCIISGIGKMNAAAAVGFMGKEFQRCAWLNIGIAGHVAKPIGESLIAHKIIDYATKKSIFPTMHPEFPQKRENIFTVDFPESHYLEDGLYDMEAYGFAHAAIRFSCAEFVQCYKIISDNITTEKKHIDKKFVSALIKAKLSEIDGIISTLCKMVKKTTPSPWVVEMYQEIEKKNRFSETQKHQLYSLLIKWNALGMNLSQIPSSKNGKEILLFLKHALEKASYAF